MKERNKSERARRRTYRRETEARLSKAKAEGQGMKAMSNCDEMKEKQTRIEECEWLRI